MNPRMNNVPPPSQEGAKGGAAGGGEGQEMPLMEEQRLPWAMKTRKECLRG